VAGGEEEFLTAEIAGNAKEKPVPGMERTSQFPIPIANLDRLHRSGGKSFADCAWKAREL
jgi:hypothetical protein